MSGFLNNSGDIILDAVLTDAGRRRMADGSFNITKFALGDDEIDYRLYNKTHPSGSAYYDLEIMQTPVFEAVVSQNAAINYGLLSITNTNLLYIPSFIINEAFPKACRTHNGIFYLAANSETKTKLSVASALGVDNKKILLANNGSTTQILYCETGLNTSAIAATLSNRSSFIVANDLADGSITVQVDSRIISTIMATSGESFVATSTSTTETIPERLRSSAGGIPAAGLSNYTNYSVPGLPNLLESPTGGTRVDLSVIAGPRGVAFGLNFGTTLSALGSGTRPPEYTQYGKTAVNLFSDGKLYDYIDTVIYFIGNNSTATLQVPIRLIRYVSG